MSDKMKKELKEWGKAFVFALCIAGVMMVAARPSFVDGKSMLPTFKNGDLVFVEKISQCFNPPEKGDIIVALTDLLTPEGERKNIIKRVIALPGDSIIIKDTKVYINGEELQEDYLYEGATSGEFEGVVPDKHVFVMGDNRYNSNDSRSSSVGYIPFDRLKGKVYLRLYPFDSIATF